MARPATVNTRTALARSLVRRGGGTMLAAADLLDDGDGAEDDDERQDAVELCVAAENRENAVAGRSCPHGRGRRVLAEARRVDAGVRVPLRGAQGRQGAPATAVVVLDFL